MFHDIIVPLDGSPLSEGALVPAGWIASECWARLHIVRVDVGRRDDGAAAASDTRESIARYLNDVASRLRAKSAYEIRVAVLHGSPALAIADYADRVQADLIVMTTHGRTGATRRRLGSVAAVVAHHVECPVLLARGQPREDGFAQTPIDRVLVAVDGSQRTGDVLAMGLQLASIGHPSFRIVYPVVSPTSSVSDGASDVPQARSEKSKAESYLCDVVRPFRSAGLRAEVEVIATEEPARALLDAAERDRADVVAIL
jgi:nucleotide-binding universal stress UspA family protein